MLFDCDYNIITFRQDGSFSHKQLTWQGCQAGGQAALQGWEQLRHGLVATAELLALTLQ
jgi:hypothetical protein